LAIAQVNDHAVGPDALIILARQFPTLPDDITPLSLMEPAASSDEARFGATVARSVARHRFGWFRKIGHGSFGERKILFLALGV